MIFALCSVVAAAAFSVAFEGGRFCERRRLLGFQPPPYKKCPGQSSTVMVAIFLILVAAEYFLLPDSFNPFSYQASAMPLSLAAAVFGSWSGILAIGYGAFITWGRALCNERKKYAMDKSDFERNRLTKEKKLQEEKLLVKKERAELITVRETLVNQQELLQVQAQLLNEETEKMMQHNSGEDFTVLPEGARVWSKKLFSSMDVKAFSVARVALEKRWREVEEWQSNLEALKHRNKEQEEMLVRMRERRQEQVKVNKDELEDERDNLRRHKEELVALKLDMEEFKEESKMREKERNNELNGRIALLDQREALLKDREEDACRHRSVDVDNENDDFLTQMGNEKMVDAERNSTDAEANEPFDERVYKYDVGHEEMVDCLSTIDEAVEDEEGSDSSQHFKSIEDERVDLKDVGDETEDDTCSSSDAYCEPNKCTETIPVSYSTSLHDISDTLNTGDESNEKIEETHEEGITVEAAPSSAHEEPASADSELLAVADNEEFAEAEHDEEHSSALPTPTVTNAAQSVAPVGKGEENKSLPNEQDAGWLVKNGQIVAEESTTDDIIRVVASDGCAIKTADEAPENCLLSCADADGNVLSAYEGTQLSAHNAAAAETDLDGSSSKRIGGAHGSKVDEDVESTDESASHDEMDSEKDADEEFHDGADGMESFDKASIANATIVLDETETSVHEGTQLSFPNSAAETDLDGRSYRFDGTHDDNVDEDVKNTEESASHDEMDSVDVEDVDEEFHDSADDLESCDQASIPLVLDEAETGVYEGTQPSVPHAAAETDLDGSSYCIDGAHDKKVVEQVKNTEESASHDEMDSVDVEDVNEEFHDSADEMESFDEAPIPIVPDKAETETGVYEGTQSSAQNVADTDLEAHDDKVDDDAKSTDNESAPHDEMDSSSEEDADEEFHDGDDEMESCCCDEASITNASIVLDEAENGVEIVVGN